MIQSRPPNLPGSLKNNSAITVISKGGRGGLQKIVSRPAIRPAILSHKLGSNVRPFATGQKIQEIKIRSAPPNLPTKPISLIRGRAPPKPNRPISIQNKLNIKIQGVTNSASDYAENSQDKIDNDEKSEEDMDTINSTNSTELGELTAADTETTQADQAMEQNQDIQEEFEPGLLPTKALQPTVPEDVISEDSSQEKTYVDLSDKAESKITTKPSSKKPSVKPESPVMMDCKIPIKKGFPHAETLKMGFMNEVTIKRTSVPSKPSTSLSSLGESTKPAPVSLMADEIFPSEATLSEHKLPTFQATLIQSADENSLEDDMFKEKKIYKPNLVDRKPKVNSLKNYRHTKSMQKPIPIQSDFSMGMVSPASTSSTPTPPPAPLPLPGIPTIAQCSLSQLEKTASSINRLAKPGGMSDFQQSLSEITKTYSPGPDSGPTEQPSYKPGPKSRKKKPTQPEPLLPENPEMLSKPIPIDTSLMKPSVPIPAPVPSLAPAPYPLPMPLAHPHPLPLPHPHPGYGDPSGLSAGFADPNFHQQAAPSTDPGLPPQQPYNTYPGKLIFMLDHP